MNEASELPPIVMTFSGHDPCGGAGIQADIETLASLGCHCTPVITAITAQDSTNVIDWKAVDPGLVVEQARAVLEDMPVKAFKMGMLGSVKVIEAIHTLLRDYAHIPVVIDPVLAAGGGTELTQGEFREAMQSLLFPNTTLLMPNSVEARRLAPQADSLEACAQALMEAGAKYVLIKGAHEPGEDVVNRLWGAHKELESFHWRRLAGSYHGSGCTLASASAAFIAHGAEVISAVRDAQQFTWSSLQAGRRLGMGQLIPNRFFWARQPQ